MSKLDELKQEVRDAVLETVNYSPEDYADGCDPDWHEVVDGCIPVYNSDLMELAQDVEVFHREPEILGFDGTPTIINTVVGALYEILMEVAYTYWDELEEEISDFRSDLRGVVQEKDGELPVTGDFDWELEEWQIYLINNPELWSE